MADYSGSESEESEEELTQEQIRESEAERRRREAEEARRRLQEEERRKIEEKERKKAEVRKRLEEAARAKKATSKKGFMTPERKKKLKNLLRRTAAEKLKKEQERKAEERKRIIAERCGQKKPLESVNEATLQAITKEFYKRIALLEEKKYDLEYEVREKDFLINELTIEINGLRGKFVKPALKKVSKFDKLKISMKPSSDIDFRSSLKSVKKDAFKIEEDNKARPEWALGAKKEGGEE